LENGRSESEGAGEFRQGEGDKKGAGGDPPAPRRFVERLLNVEVHGFRGDHVFEKLHLLVLLPLDAAAEAEGAVASADVVFPVEFSEASKEFVQQVVSARSFFHGKSFGSSNVIISA
jgi:hypothetical protein